MVIGLAREKNPSLKSRRNEILQAVGLGLIYFALGRLGRYLDVYHGLVAPLSPASGLALGVIIVYGRALWPGLFLGAFFFHHSESASIAFSLVLAASETLSLILTSRLLESLAFQKDYRRTQDILLLSALSFLLSALVDASIGTIAARFFGFIEAPNTINLWFTWWLASALGKVIVGSFVLTWLEEKNSKPRIPYSSWRRFEVIALHVIVIGLALILFSKWSGYGYLRLLRPYMLLPLVLWATLRFGRRISTAAIFSISLISVLGTFRGYGRFGNPHGPEGLLSLQLYIVILTITFLLFDAVIEAKNRSEEALRKSESRFRRLVEADIIGVYFWDPSGRITQPNNAFLRMLGYTEQDFREAGLDWKDLTPPEHQRITQKAVSELRRKGVSPTYEKEYYRKDGTKLPAIVGSALLRAARFRRRRRRLPRQARTAFQRLNRLASRPSHSWAA